jgi:hypothetical protein
MFKCSRTKRLVPTHVDVDPAEIDKLPDRITFFPISLLQHCARTDTKGHLGLRRQDAGIQATSYEVKRPLLGLAINCRINPAIG